MSENIQSEKPPLESLMTPEQAEKWGQHCKKVFDTMEEINKVTDIQSEKPCPECGCMEGHKINCRTGNDRATTYQRKLAKRRKRDIQSEKWAEEAAVKIYPDLRPIFMDIVRDYRKKAAAIIKDAIDRAVAAEREKLKAWVEQEIENAQDLANEATEHLLLQTESKRKLQSQLAAAQADTKRLLDALLKARETIEIWHGDVAWQEYQHSPEMKQINSEIDAAMNQKERPIIMSGDRDGWGYQVNLTDQRIHYFRNGDSLCGKKTGGGFMSSTPCYPKCETCASRLDDEIAFECT